MNTDKVSLHHTKNHSYETQQNRSVSISVNQWLEKNLPFAAVKASRMHKPQRSPRALRLIPLPSRHAPILFEKDPFSGLEKWSFVKFREKSNMTKISISTTAALEGGRKGEILWPCVGFADPGRDRRRKLNLSKAPLK
jgi:hypothetical protein